MNSTTNPRTNPRTSPGTNTGSAPKAGTSAGAGRRSQHERRAHTHEALLQSAIECITTTGAATVTTQQIASNAGLSRGAVQHNFGSPENLYLKVVERGWNTLIALHQSAPPSTEPLPERISGWAHTMHTAYDCDAARAAYELLVFNRHTPTFMSKQIPLLKKAEETLDTRWCEAFADTGQPTDELIRIRGVARTFLLGALIRRISDPMEETSPTENLARIITALIHEDMDVVSDPVGRKLLERAHPSAE